MDLNDDSYSNSAYGIRETLMKKRAILRMPTLEALLPRFSPSERLALYACSILLASSALVLLATANSLVSVEVPVRGGTWTEGLVGPARFINPVLTLSGADEDLTSLVYSGLMRSLPDGSYIPDLAESYEISDDGTVYTFRLRSGAAFHDGTPVTSADVLYTVTQAQNPDIRSPRQADWVGVVAEAPDARTVVFTLPHAYAPFIENTTMGVLPKHLWESVSADEFPFSTLNTRPVGSGPYRIKSATTDSTGAVTRYELVPFGNFTLGEAYLKRITFLFYGSEDDALEAFNAGSVDALASVSAAYLSSLKRTDVKLVQVTLPRTFGVFFNQNRAPVLADASVRAALSAAIDKDALVNSVLGGFGASLDGPLPPGLTGITETAKPTALPRTKADASSTATSTSPVEEARSILEQNGWSFDETDGWTKKKESLTFSLSTADQPELIETANRIVAAWQALGAQVTLQVYPLSEFNTNVLRPRSYDAVLFGEVVGRSLDLFAFWHSSQRNDPGLNLAMYANSKADSLLSQARGETDAHARERLYEQFADIVEKDQPAVFLYAPEFLYLVPRKMQGIELGALTSPSERFLTAYRWYTDTKHVWSFFTNV